MLITVKVTKEVLIRSALCGFGDKHPIIKHCAIAVALHQIFPNVTVHSEMMEVREKGQVFYMKLPVIATTFIARFDQRVELVPGSHDAEATAAQRIGMTPISFDINVPDELIGRIGISQVYKILSESKTLEHVN